jgi:Ca2+-binding RTX toxin-like protein
VAAGISSSIYSSNGNFFAYCNSSYNSDQVNFSNIERFQITGTSAADTIRTGSGNDSINSGAGNYSIDAGAGNDSILAGDGNDTIASISGIDSIDGGAGLDTLIDGRFGAATTGLSFDDLDTSKNVNLADGTTVLNVEYFTNLTLGSGGDTITNARRLNNTINTGGGDDTINGGLGNDQVDGGAGVDLLIVDYSRNTYAGTSPAAGISSSSYSNGSSGFNGYVWAYYNSSYNYDQVNFSNIERFQITGTSAADTIRTGSGNDTINSGAGNDSIIAASGDDLLIGGSGSDTLTGGDGRDSFQYQSIDEGGDLITDFRGAFDQIRVSASGFGGGLSSGIDLVASGRYVESSTGTATSAAGVGQFIYNTTNTTLLWDVDGSGAEAARILAQLSGPLGWSGASLQVL